MKTATIIPCFNEARRIDLPSILKLLEDQNNYIYFVNDGSTDQTQKILEDYAKQNSRIKVVNLKKNQGKAEAVRTGLQQALNDDFAIVGYIDADLATPVFEVLKLLNYIKSKPISFIMGLRLVRLGANVRRKKLRHYIGRVFATIASSVILKLRVYDTQCGAKFFKNLPEIQKALEKPFATRWIFDVELIGRVNTLRPQSVSPSSYFYEFPLNAWNEIEGSKIKLKDFLKTPYEMFRVWRSLKKYQKSL